MYEKIARVNWVRCPNCQYRYYVGPQFFFAKEAMAICPHCLHEFDPKTHLESKITETSVGERWV